MTLCYVLSVLVGAPLLCYVVVHWQSSTPPCYALLVFMIVPLLCFVTVCQCILDVFCWCSLAPPCYVLLVLIGTSFCVLLMFINTSLLLLVFISAPLLCFVLACQCFIVMLCWWYLGFQIGTPFCICLYMCVGMEILAFLIAHIFQHFSTTRFFLNYRIFVFVILFQMCVFSFFRLEYNHEYLL